jgi:G-protein signaling modulator 2
MCVLQVNNETKPIRGASNTNTNTTGANILTLSNRSESPDDLLDMIVGMQSKRMDEQRVALPHLPGLNPPPASQKNQMIQRLSLAGGDNSAPDDAFLEMLMRCQGSRLEDQRSSLPEEPPAPEARKAPTVPDEDFFSLILRLQSGRMEDQRAAVPATMHAMKNGAVPNVGQKEKNGNNGGRKEKKK